jgi:hypothetical protein
MATNNKRNMEIKSLSPSLFGKKKTKAIRKVV